MSFDIYTNKPNLVEPKLVKYFTKKLKDKELLEKQKIEEIQTKEIIEQKETYENKIHIKIGKTCWEFIKEYYGFFIVILLIIILLYIRYIEVSKKKEKIKVINEQLDA